MLLSTHGLTKEFGGITAVDGVEFTLEEEELCSVIGPNGAGKTTFFNLLTGVLEPTRGRIEFLPKSARREAIADALAEDEELASRFETEAELAGAIEAGDVSSDVVDPWLEPVDVTGASPHETALLGIHRSYQVTNIFPTVSVLENVRIAVQAHQGNDSWRFWRNVNAFDDHIAEAESILERIGLLEYADEPAENLSHGEKRNLEIGIALAGDPDVLLLDEPTAGVSSEDVDRVTDIIEDVASDHAVMLIEHNMDVVMGISDRVAVLNQGELIAQGEPEEIRQSEAVQRAYLGGYEGDGSSTAAATDGGSDREVSAG
ncbi:ABC transporter ATP-binding protein [Natronobacterium texcoconense]|uniref:Branched-chain amino acid transport system ATP-binding protein n=1 Tax=Natronobacterium texcoconense TaxID=1095778 RepID=A0A1H1J4H9_NATTX|nr:ABC transporter ATP-binding protein [Natronobacterium texcoconense]SDR44829.1 branched-chain amino acid transport system ATP-binding protein [Natronobacterium texcoconense]